MEHPHVFRQSDGNFPYAVFCHIVFPHIAGKRHAFHVFPQNAEITVILIASDKSRTGLVFKAQDFLLPHAVRPVITFGNRLLSGLFVLKKQGFTIRLAA